MSCPQDLLELSRHLKQERLFINAEREALQELNEEIANNAERLGHIAWISRQQRLTLEQLILASPDTTHEVDLISCLSKKLYKCWIFEIHMLQINLHSTNQ